MEPHSLGVGDSFDEVAEEFGAVSLTPPVGVLALALQDGDELRTGLEEPTPFADALEDAAEEGGPRAVTVGQQSTMVGTGRLSVRDRSRCQGRAGESVVLGLDRLGHLEVLIGDGAVRDARVGQRHVHGTVAEQRGNRFEAHAPIDGLGREDVVEVVVDGVKIALDTADNSISEPMIRNREYEPEVTRVLRHVIRPGMTVLDIGANVGFFTALSAGLVGESGRVIAVEPNSENCRLILRTAEINQYDNVELLPIALAETNGWSHFVNHLGSNGSLAGKSESELVGGWGQIVPVLRGDDLIDGSIDVVKMDVEGAEARVVRGMAVLIEEHRPVVVTEASEEMLKRVSGCSLREYLTWFEERNYSVHLISTNTESPIAFPDVKALLATWSDPFRIENLLLLPGQQHRA